MPNLISLVCPSCGGKLKVSTNALTMTCQFCGNEHMVKHEAGGAVSLEAYARCPTCGRNDKAEKVSAILSSQTQEISGTEKKQELVGPAGQQRLLTRDVPFTRQQVSVLGRRLLPPNPPSPSDYPPFPPAPVLPNKPSGGKAVTLLVSGITLSALTICSGLCASLMMFGVLIDPTTEGSAEVSVLSIIGLVVSILFFLVGIGLVIAGVNLRKKAASTTDPTIAIRRQHQQRVEAVQREHYRIKNEYDHALERYEKLYYCFRDDCVFIPGENTSAPLAKMLNYLSEHPLKKPEE
jgi:hypothetical protein